ncbi:MAG TPA: NAD-dependent epimerase/dehydratase family protein [Candidatus Eisenbacteria bacterium]
MTFLFIGGTQFVGRHLVEAARAAGHDVTLFHRGKTNPGLFPDIEHIHGDRATDIGKLAGRRWDRVIDLCGYLPRVVTLSADALRLNAAHYTFISSISVYKELDTVTVASGMPPDPIDEMRSVIELADPTVEEITGETYGGLKYLCEQAARQVFGHTRVLIVRPGLIVGPYDHTDRFTYWCHRAAAGGVMVVPGSPERHFPVIDVRDLVAWILPMSDRAASGVVNLGGPNVDGFRGGYDTGPEPTFANLLEAVGRATGASIEPVWMSSETMSRHGIDPESFPLWNQDAAGHEATFAIDSDRAFGSGLRCRPLADTVRDTLAWRTPLLSELPLKVGPTREREAEMMRLVRG